MSEVNRSLDLGLDVARIRPSCSPNIGKIMANSSEQHTRQEDVLLPSEGVRASAGSARLQTVRGPWIRRQSPKPSVPDWPKQPVRTTSENLLVVLNTLHSRLE